MIDQTETRFRRAAVVAALLLCSLSRLSAEESPPPLRRELTGKPWIDMDYGQFLSSALEVESGNIAHKGISIRLDGFAGGVSNGSEFVVFDTDTLRYAAGWVGPAFSDWRSIVWDGSHQTHPSIRGSILFRNPPGPGWARPGTESFADDRVVGRDGVRYGPLPRAWAHWQGLYVHGEDVVLSYTVGESSVLEAPDAERSRGPDGGALAFTRTLQVGPRSRELLLQVAADRESELTFHDVAAGAASRPVAVFVPRELPAKSPRAEAKEAAAGDNAGDDAGDNAGDNAGDDARELLTFDGTTCLDVAGSEAFDLTENDFTIQARLRTNEGGTIFAKAPRDGRWVRDGKTLFIRDGALAYDIGWVGVVQTEKAIADGAWHDVAAAFEKESGTLALWVDGKRVAQKDLAPKERRDGESVRIGYTSFDFPEERSAFAGEIAELRFYQRRLADAELAGAAEAEDRELIARWRRGASRGDRLADESGNGHHAVVRTLAHPQRFAAESTLAELGAVTVVAVAGGAVDLAWRQADGGRLRLAIPAGDAPVRFQLVYTRAEDPRAGVDAMAGILAGLAPPRDLEALTRGGPARWKEELRTEVRPLGNRGGPFEVDAISVPTENPYHAWMRPGGFDFFAGGERAAVCTWNGDVWTVDGLGGELASLAWRRIASGLYQPLGLVIVEDTIHVLGRDQITRLRDLDGDGETDFYENFNNDAQATEHFHEFAMDLQRDAEGNFYYTKGGRHALDAVVPHHGTLLKVPPDGSRTDVIASGFRAPNGLALNGDGTFIVSDQEGHWTPENRINRVVPGGFYGYVWGYPHGTRPASYDRPLAWVDHEIDTSPAEQLWATSERWGALAGKLLSLSYGKGEVHLVLHEQIDGEMQGGVIRLPIPAFPTGILRGRFHPRDGQLYVCGLFGWSSERTFPGGLYRIRRTETPLHLPVELHATTEGVYLRFSEPLAAQRAARAGSYAVERWNYRWAERYGSDDFIVSSGQPGRERVPVAAVELSADGRSVFLCIEDMRPAMQQKLEYRLEARDGTRLAQKLYHTIHVLGPAAPWREKVHRE